ncbi:MAG: spore cortex biosynthesis protein YabQ [Bacillota bacterium]|nr:spore cortex biosynthesis protein YabQ [Bacillota bacterium]
MMILTVQIRSVFVSITAGLIVGILFDLYRIFRGFNNPNKYITFFEDILFWTLSAILVFIFLLRTNYAYVGLYVYAFIGLGLYLYIRIISKVYIKIQYLIIKKVSKAVRIIRNIIFYPFRLLFYKKKSKKK